jgi:hypothetical protein
VLEVVTGRTDLAGTRQLAPAVTVQRVPAAAVTSGRYRLTVRPGSGAYVRTQVRLADNRLIAASNPVWLLPKAPPRGVPADRKRRL